MTAHGEHRTCTYGGDCTAPTAYVMTRTDGMDREGRTAYACREHRKDLTVSMSEYVSGWGARWRSRWTPTSRSSRSR